MTIDEPTSAPRVIVVERRSLASQIGGVWFVALPLLAAYGICRVPYDIPETAAAQLRLGPGDWIAGRSPTKATLALTSATPEADVAPPLTVDAQVASAPKPVEPIPVVPKPPAQPEPLPMPTIPQGVVVLNVPGAGVNPVAVFDPAGKEAAESAPEPPTLAAALDFGGGPPDEAETRQALAEIQKASETAKAERERNEALKPLVAMHEQAQAEKRDAEREEFLRRRAVAGRKEFMDSLGEILRSDTTITQQGRQIDLLIRRDVENADTEVYRNLFQKLDSSKRPASRATKLRYLRAAGVPESIILSYMIQLDMRDIRKSTGPRDNDDAIVRSAKLLMKSNGER
jgi:hypothetical protein